MDIKAAGYNLSPQSTQAATQGRPLQAVAEQNEANDTVNERKEAAGADVNQNSTAKGNPGPNLGKNIDISA